MAKSITVTSPNKAFTGESAGIKFANGTAEVDPKAEGAEGALAYFRSAGFTVGSETPETITAAAITTLTDFSTTALNKFKLDELRTIALDKGAKGTGATKAELITEIQDAEKLKNATASEKQAGIQAPVQEQVAGDGPAGPLHNVGRDGANPDATGTPMTPADAGI